MKLLRTSVIILALILTHAHSWPVSREDPLFAAREDKEDFAREVSYLIERGWKEWQDNIEINDVDVEGSSGIISAGDIGEHFFSSDLILRKFDRKNRSQEYIDCIRVISGAVAKGMRLWQQGYSNTGIPFPRGASCVYTLTPCYNVPVLVNTGSSTGDSEMSKEVLYSYMLYRTPLQDEDVLDVFRSAAESIEKCFHEWEDSCLISDILASGGVAPQPSPMGNGPGMVRGAKGFSGRLTGAYFNAETMRENMCEYFRVASQEEDSR